MVDREEIEKRFRKIQNDICISLEKLDGKEKFINENWSRFSCKK